MWGVPTDESEDHAGVERALEDVRVPEVPEEGMILDLDDAVVVSSTTHRERAYVLYETWGREILLVSFRVPYEISTVVLP